MQFETFKGHDFSLGTNEQGTLDVMISKALIILNNVKKWLTDEAEPLFLTCASQHQLSQGPFNYPDILAGVLDCGANKALLTVHEYLRFLCHARLRSSARREESREQHQMLSSLLDDPETVERWRQRARSAFQFVKGESTLAAKPLEFGLRQMEFGSSGHIIID